MLEVIVGKIFVTQRLCFLKLERKSISEVLGGPLQVKYPNPSGKLREVQFQWNCDSQISCRDEGGQMDTEVQGNDWVCRWEVEFSNPIRGTTASQWSRITAGVMGCQGLVWVRNLAPEVWIYWSISRDLLCNRNRHCCSFPDERAWKTFFFYFFILKIMTKALRSIFSNEKKVFDPITTTIIIIINNN